MHPILSGVQMKPPGKSTKSWNLMVLPPDLKVLTRSHSLQLESPKSSGAAGRMTAPHSLPSAPLTYLSTDLLNGNSPFPACSHSPYSPLTYINFITHVSIQILFLKVEGNLFISLGLNNSQWWGSDEKWAACACPVRSEMSRLYVTDILISPRVTTSSLLASLFLLNSGIFLLFALHDV